VKKLMSKSKVKTSSKLLNILLIIIGLLFIIRVVLDFLSLLGIIPEFLGDITAILESSESLTIFGSQSLISIALGFWSIVAGVGMFKEEEWAMGQALVILSIMVISGISPIFGWITDPASFDIYSISMYITLSTFIIGLIGFIWLLATRKRYD
jgi:hypothetical protein